MNNSKILVFIDWYLPGTKAGGPVKSVTSFIQALKPYFQFSVITSDTDYTDSTAYKNIKSNTWSTAPDGTRTYYCSTSSFNFNSLKFLLQKEDYQAIYLNGIFSLKFTLFPLLLHRYFVKGKKVVVAPKGMLASGARSVKPLKKNIFITIAKLTGLFKNVTWHASSEQEKNEIKNTFGSNATIIVAPNLSHTRILKSENKTKTPGELTLFYLGRISEEKNTLAAINYLSTINQKCSITLDIFGTIYNQAYWQVCEQAIRKLPATIKVNYKGSIDSAEVQNNIKKYHFLLLPTLGENFGHAIIESLASGCPVIISDKTIWRNLQNNNAGWDLPLEDNTFKQVLDTCIAMNNETYQAMVDASISYAKSFLNDSKLVDANKSLFS